MTTAASTTQFLDELARSERNVLILDYDGTLAPFQVERDRAYPYPGVAPLLAGIQETGRTRLVLVSGRPAQDVRRLLELDPAPEIWGVHGFERLLPSGEFWQKPLSATQQRGLAEADAWLEREGLGRLAEIKSGSIAVHWRGMEERAVGELQMGIRRLWQPLASAHDLCLEAFDGGIELRVRTVSKGDAVRTIVSEVGSSVPVAYLGDDLTDEDAFAALAGRGLTVLVRPEYRPTRAAAWIRPPEELLELLGEWLQACGGTL
jgi:trehalose 6-phosphate phosphatase